MLTQSEAELREAWEQAWRMFDEVLSDLDRESEGDPWDEWALAQFLDVPSFAIGELVPAVTEAGWVVKFDFIGRIRKAVADALPRLEGGSKGPLPLQWGLTGAILAWEWGRMVSDRDRPWTFFERLRELRVRMPEVSFCERTVHRFCDRVPDHRFE